VEVFRRRFLTKLTEVHGAHKGREEKIKNKKEKNEDWQYPKLY